jgi:lysozyme
VINQTVADALRAELGADLEKEITLDEADKLFVYDDATGKPIVKGTLVKGNPTIARGRNLAGRGISRAESEYMWANDLAALEADLEPLLPWLGNLSANRQCAVYSLYFNTALGNPQHFVTAGWPHFLAQMQAGEFEAAATNLETSQPWASEVGARSTRLATLVRNG